jgi:hypothetical protein
MDDAEDLVISVLQLRRGACPMFVWVCPCQPCRSARVMHGPFSTEAAAIEHAKATIRAFCDEASGGRHH